MIWNRKPFLCNIYVIIKLHSDMLDKPCSVIFPAPIPSTPQRARSTTSQILAKCTLVRNTFLQCLKDVHWGVKGVEHELGPGWQKRYLTNSLKCLDEGEKKVHKLIDEMISDLSTLLAAQEKILDKVDHLELSVWSLTGSD